VIYFVCDNCRWFDTVVIIPEAPSSVDVNAVNTTALRVTWSASNNTDFYQVTCGVCGVNLSLNETAYVIGGLTPGTSYSVSVAACSSQCSGLVNSTNNTGITNNRGVSFSRCRFYWHCPHSMRSRVCVVVRCLSICLSVPAWAHGSKLTEHCRLAAVGLAGRRYQLLHGRHSAVTVGECRQCHIVSVRRKLNTDLFFFFICCCLCIFGACS